MENKDSPSWVIRFIGPVFFILGALASLFWFAYSIDVLLNELSLETVMVDKGSFYMLGVGVGLATLAFVVVYEFWFNKTLSEKLTKVCNRLAVLSIVLLLLLPQVLHYITDSYLTKNGYTICAEESSQWLFVSEMLYVQNMQECGISAK